jgi:LysM repeat protein
MNNNEDRAVRKVIIDPGHGGTDSGATGNNLLEKDYNLLISKYMYDRFKELGIPVAITRDSDTTLSPTDRVNTILNKFGNSSDVILISNHVNSGGGEGAEVIYALRNKDTLAKNILNNIGATGQETRKYYQRRLPSDTSKDYYFIHRNTGNLEPLIVEYGFIDSAKDVNFLKENYEELAEAVISAVANYIGVPYTPPEGLITNTYIVQKGDSLYSIANKLGTTVSELKRENNLTSNTLQIGQVLRIPSKEVYEGETNIYTVKSGDSLYKIAQNNNTTVDEIKRLNSLTSNNLVIGQTLKLPSPLTPENTYTVKSDSLYKIAQKYNTTVDELKRANNLTSNILSVGQILKLPNTSSETPSSNTVNYTVKSGDSLYKIAGQYNVTVDAIKRANNLTTNNLQIGQVLRIPLGTSRETTYTVKSGDSLYSIAKKYNTTVNRLKELNNLSSNLLNIGQILIVG